MASACGHQARPPKLSPSPWRLANPAPNLAPKSQAAAMARNTARRTCQGTGRCGESRRRAPRRRARTEFRSSVVRHVRHGAPGPLGRRRGADRFPASTRRISSHPQHRAEGRRASNPAATRRQHPRPLQLRQPAQARKSRWICAKDRGREILWQLLPKFDIVADNFRPGVLPSWGHHPRQAASAASRHDLGFDFRLWRIGPLPGLSR